MKEFLRPRLAVLAWLSLLAALAPLAASVHFAADLASHFTLHIGLAAAGLALALIVLRRPYSAAAAMLTLCVCLWRVLVVTDGTENRTWRASARPTGAAELRVLQWNVNIANPDPQEVLGWIASLDPAPDLIALLEVGPVMARAVATRDWHYRVLLSEPREDAFGIALLSTRRELKATVHTHRNLAVPSAVVVLCNGAPGAARIIASHPPPPMGALLARHRNEQLEELVDLVRADGASVLLGDLNLTPWSATYRALLRDGQLRPGFAGLPPATWSPPWVPLWLGIPIDLVLLSPGVRVTQQLLGPRLGSDHAPVISTLRFDAGECPG